MARRGHIGGGRQRLQFDPSAFLQAGGGRENKDDTDTAMAIMGYGKGGSRELDLNRERLMAEIAHQGVGEDIERQKLGIEERRLGSQEEFQNWQKQKEQERAIAELGYKTKSEETERQKSRDTVLKEYLGLTTDAAERRRLIDALSPEARADTLAQEGLKKTEAAKQLLPLVQQAYEKGDTGLIKKLTTGVDPEVLQRPEFEWQKWNQGMVPAGQRGISGGQGILGALWNIPGALQNVGKGIANVASSALLGEDAPQTEYTKFSRLPVDELRRMASESRSGPPNIVAPSETTYGPQPGAPESEPYRYGTGNLPLPIGGMDAFPSVEDLIARSQYKTPPPEPINERYPMGAGGPMDIKTILGL